MSVATVSVCAGCDTELPPKTWQGRDQKWCSDRCRKLTLYSRHCVDCGAICNTDGRVTEAAERCGQCASRHSALERKVWTREAIIGAIQDWAREYGSHPAMAAECHRMSVLFLHDEARALRFESAEGRFPRHNTVVREFGTWNAAVVAAGFQPRASHGGSGNQSRRPVTAYVQPHGLVFTDHAYDALTDELATEDPEHRERGLFESPSKYLARTSHRRADQPGASTTQPSPPAGCPDHDAPAQHEP